MRCLRPGSIVVKHSQIGKESTRQRGIPKGSALIPDTSALDGSELQLPGCVVDYARGGGSSGCVVTESGVSETPTAIRSGTSLACPNAVVADASAAGAHGTID